VKLEVKVPIERISQRECLRARRIDAGTHMNIPKCVAAAAAVCGLLVQQPSTAGQIADLHVSVVAVRSCSVGLPRPVRRASLTVTCTRGATPGIVTDGKTIIPVPPGSTVVVPRSSGSGGAVQTVTINF
jgi:hypothetical protein